MTSSPFCDLQDILKTLPKGDDAAAKAAQTTTNTLDSILGGGGALAEAFSWLARWQGKKSPSVDEAHICLFAASHAHGKPVKDLQAILGAATKGQAPINMACVDHGIGLRVLELALELPLQSPDQGPLFSERDTMAGVAFGMEAAASGGDLLALGDLAYGTEVNSLAIVTALLGETPIHWGGDRLSDRYLTLTTAALSANPKAMGDPLYALRALGGREVATMVGAIIAARTAGLPVLLDGWAGLAAATVLHGLQPSALEHCRAANAVSKGQARAWQAIGLTPMLTLDIDLGQGIGAATAIGLLHSSVRLYGV